MDLFKCMILLVVALGMVALGLPQTAIAAEFGAFMAALLLCAVLFAVLMARKQAASRVPGRLIGVAEQSRMTFRQPGLVNRWLGLRIWTVKNWLMIKLQRLDQLLGDTPLMRPPPLPPPCHPCNSLPSTS